MTSIRSAKGFTLIELMIVVAIIGILAAIAIPNFLKFQCKSKRAEAKTNLGGIYTAELSYFSERGLYSGFSDIGFAPSGGNCRYTYQVAPTGTAVACQAGVGITAGTVIIQVNAPLTPVLAAAATCQLAGTQAVPANSTGSYTATGTAGANALGGSFDDVQANSNGNKDITDCGNPC